jgi:2-dehydropantoate 2-reductase
MKILVMGAGAVGGYFGARLAAAGSDVTFVARGAHLAAIRDQGLRIESPLGNVHVKPAKVTDDPTSAGIVDAALFAVKLWDTEEAAERLRPVVAPGTAVISLQNGVQKDEVLRSVLGSEAIVGGVSYIAATIAQPGVIRHTGKLQKIVLGEYDGNRSARCLALLEACKRAGIEAELNDDIERAIWEKFVFIVGLSATTSAIRLPIGPIRSHLETRALLLDVMREAVTVGRAGGVRLDPNFAEDRLAFCDTVSPDMTSSMHMDLERGNRLELRWLSGAVVELGQKRGVPTPANRVLYDTLVLHSEGKGTG